MADFSQFRSGGPTASAATVKQGVSDNSTAVAVNSLASLVGNLSDMSSKNREAKKEKGLATAKSTITRELVTISDAHAMGDMDQRTAQASIRKKYDQALARGDIPSEDLRTIFGDFIDIGDSVKKGTKEEQEAARVRQAALDDGWVTPNMSGADAQQALMGYQEFTLQGKKLERMAANTSQQTAATRQEQRAALSGLSISYTDKFKRDSEKTLGDLASGTITNEEAVMELQNQWATIQTVINSQGSEAGGEFLNTLTAPMKTLFENAEQVASGKMSREVFENLSARNIAAAKANITGDEGIANLVAFSSMIKNSDIVLSKQFNEATLKFMARNGDITKKPADLTDPDSKAESQDYLSITRDSIKKVNNGSAVDLDKTKVEVQANISQILKGVGQYGVNVDKPEELNDVSNFLADPSTGAYLVASGGVPADVAMEAKVVFEENYRAPAIQALLKDFNGGRIKGVSSNVLGFGPLSNNDVAASVLPVFSGTGVTFMVDSSVKGVDRVAVKARVKDLNKNSAPLLNKLIRLDAHLGGTQDYAKVYRENYEEMFSPKAEEEPAPQKEPAPVMDERPLLERTLPKEQYAKLEELKKKGYTRSQVEDMLNYLDIAPDRGTGVDMFKAIREVFNAGS